MKALDLYWPLANQWSLVMWHLLKNDLGLRNAFEFQLLFLCYSIYESITRILGHFSRQSWDRAPSIEPNGAIQSLFLKALIDKSRKIGFWNLFAPLIYWFLESCSYSCVHSATRFPAKRMPTTRVTNFPQPRKLTLDLQKLFLKRSWLAGNSKASSFWNSERISETIQGNQISLSAKEYRITKAVAHPHPPKR